MAEYPNSIFDPRVVSNVDGVVYEPEQATRIFAEDINFTNEELVAVQDTLGLNPEGLSPDVNARLVSCGSLSKVSGFEDLGALGTTRLSMFEMDLPSLVAGDTCIIRTKGAIFNNSGGTRTYSLTFWLRTIMSEITFPATIVANANNWSVFDIEGTFTFFSTSNIPTNIQIRQFAPAENAYDTAGSLVSNGIKSNIYTEFDLAGSTPFVRIAIRSNNAASGQTLHRHFGEARYFR